MSDKAFPTRTVLLLSLALNILVLGAAAGAYLSGARLARPADETLVERLPGPRGFMQSLPEAERGQMRQRFASTWRASRPLREEARAAREAAFRAATTEPFDAERVKTAFARQRAADQAAVGAYHDAIIEAFGEMSPGERRAALEALRNAPPAHRQRPERRRWRDRRRP